MKRAKKNFHVPMPPGLYDRLRAESERRGTAATTLVREAVEVWLEQSERERLRREIAAYAADAAGTADDLDGDLEAASIEHLTDEPEEG